MKRLVVFLIGLINHRGCRYIIKDSRLYSYRCVKLSGHLGKHAAHREPQDDDEYWSGCDERMVAPKHVYVSYVD